MNCLFLQNILMPGSVLHDDPYVQTMNSCLRDLLSLWFSVGFLTLERITWQSSCDILQKVCKQQFCTMFPSLWQLLLVNTSKYAAQLTLQTSIPIQSTFNFFQFPFTQLFVNSIQNWSVVCMWCRWQILVGAKKSPYSMVHRPRVITLSLLVNNIIINFDHFSVSIIV